jgi:hypothetical protein
MLSQEAIDIIARVVAARVKARPEELNERDIASAHEHLQTVDEAHRKPELGSLIADADRGQSVEYAVKRLMLQGATVAWPLLKRIVELCPRDRDVLGYVGAGMFEDWVSEARVAAVERELTDLLRSDAKWRVVAEASWDEPPSLIRLLADPVNLPVDPL